MADEREASKEKLATTLFTHPLVIEFWFVFSVYEKAPVAFVENAISTGGLNVPVILGSPAATLLRKVDNIRHT